LDGQSEMWPMDGRILFGMHNVQSVVRTDAFDSCVFVFKFYDYK